MGFDTAIQGTQLMAGLNDIEREKAEQQRAEDIDRVKRTSEYKHAAAVNDKAKMLKLENAAAKESHGLRVKIFEKGQDIARAEVYINAAQAALKVWTQLGIYAPWGLALLGVQTKMQLSAISAQQAPSFAQGGLVGGRRHSQGGTMIEAEQGEFIMSRNAVDALGVEAMNRINQGGGAGGIQINITGNVLSEEYTEDIIVPQIKTALRRGGDLGVS